jgi:predicted RNase H-like HicB family nuclease
MNMDSITSVYSDTRTEYTKQLCIFLIPAYFQFFVDLLGKAKQGSEPKKVLWQFQTMLNEIHDWNMEKVHNEINTIHGNTGCDYLEDLLTAVFIAHTKVLTAIRLSANNKKVEITIPKVEHFLFKVLCEISKLLWSSTYLFREDISGIDRQQNYKLIEGIIGEGILQAIRSLVPVKSILKNLVNQEETKETKETDKEDSDDEDIAVKPQAESSRKVLLYPGEDSYFVVEVPSLPGCISQGKTREEALANIEEAIALYIEVLQDRGEPFPNDTVEVILV